MIEEKGMKRAINPYAKTISGKCFKYNQPRHQSSDCPLRKKLVHMIDRDEEEGEKFIAV